MISKKGKRKITVGDSTYYWYVRVTESSHRIHIMTEDKSVHIEAPFPDTEASITPKTVREMIERHISGAYDK